MYNIQPGYTFVFCFASPFLCLRFTFSIYVAVSSPSSRIDQLIIIISLQYIDDLM